MSCFVFFFNFCEQAEHRWLVSGLQQVKRTLNRSEAKLLIVANNLDPGVQIKVSEVISIAEEKGVPVVRALTRNRMGKIFHKTKRMAAIAVLDDEGVENIASSVLHYSHTSL